MKDLHHFYNSRKNEFTAIAESVQKKIRQVVFIRIFIALIILFFIYLGFFNSFFWYSLVPLAITFGYFVSRHVKLKEELDLNMNLVALNELELKALDHDYKTFPDGSVFIDPHHAYSYDLDLFGPGSLYQYLNRCGTAIGENQLADELKSGSGSVEEIIHKQSVVEELSEKVSLRQWFWAQGRLLKDSIQENSNLLEWLSGKNTVKGRMLVEWLLIIFPLISIVLIGMIIYDFKFFVLIVVLTMLQLYIVSLFSREILKADEVLTRYRRIFEKYARLLSAIASEDFKSEKLKKIQYEAKEASEEIRKFSRLVNAFESRRNDFAKIFGNGLYLYDLQCLYKLEKWRDQNSHKVSGWLNKIAVVDSFISLATFHFNHPPNTFPKFESGLHLSGKNAGHPLINAKERIDNSFDLGHPQNIMFITGANMAGKSTFLRTVGVNLVLAYSGSSVCASEFRCSVMDLYTGMRATDSLVEHTSYFYAELSRLKMIMEKIRSGQPVFVLLDEVLRGTNSRDKQEGSIGLIKQFVEHKVLVMLASHDVALGELEKQFPAAIRNFCFESEIKGEALSFDYTLHAGAAQRANATFLMKKMGILPAG